MWHTHFYKKCLTPAWTHRAKRPTRPGKNAVQLRKTGSWSVLLHCNSGLVQSSAYRGRFHNFREWIVCISKFWSKLFSTVLLTQTYTVNISAMSYESISQISCFFEINVSLPSTPVFTSHSYAVADMNTSNLRNNHKR